MKPAEELIRKNHQFDQRIGEYKHEFVTTMKEYARQCCEQLLKDAAENARLISFTGAGDAGAHLECTICDKYIKPWKQSILNTEIKTP